MLNARLAKEWYTWPSAPGQGDRLQQRAPRSSQAWRSFDAPRWAEWCPRPLNEIRIAPGSSIDSVTYRAMVE